MKDAERLQTANANLLKSMIGEDAKIAVLPIEMSVTTTDNKILSANKPSTTSLLATDFLIGLSKADAQAEIDKLIPVEKPAVVSEAYVEPTTTARSKSCKLPETISLAEAEPSSIKTTIGMVKSNGSSMVLYTLFSSGTRPLVVTTI